MRRPVAPEALEPGVYLAQRLGTDRVEASRAVGSHAGEASVAQDSEVSRHPRLGDAELRLHYGADRARRPLAVGQQLEDPPPDRITQDIERVHLARDRIRRCLYKSSSNQDGPTPSVRHRNSCSAPSATSATLIGSETKPCGASGQIRNSVAWPAWRHRASMNSVSSSSGS